MASDRAANKRSSANRYEYTSKKNLFLGSPKQIGQKFFQSIHNNSLCKRKDPWRNLYDNLLERLSGGPGESNLLSVTPLKLSFNFHLFWPVTHKNSSHLNNQSAILNWDILYHPSSILSTWGTTIYSHVPLTLHFIFIPTRESIILPIA